MVTLLGRVSKISILTSPECLANVSWQKVDWGGVRLEAAKPSLSIAIILAQLNGVMLPKDTNSKFSHELQA